MNSNEQSLPGSPVIGVKPWVEMCRQRWQVPLSWVETDAEGVTRLPTAVGGARAWLDELIANSPNYAWSLMAGRYVLHPKDGVWSRQLVSRRITMPRHQAAAAYVELLRGDFPDLADLAPPLLKGDPRAPIYSEVVDVPENPTVLQGLVALLGRTLEFNFSIVHFNPGRRVLYFEATHPDAGNGS